MNTFNKIGVIGRKSEAVGALRCLINYLASQQVDTVLGEDIASLVPDSDLPVGSRKQMGESCDLFIVLGGDGSLLGAARMLAHYNVPVLGINRGRLGFLTDILPEEIEQRVGAV